MQGQNCPERQIICVGVSGNDKRPALIPGYAMPPDRVRWFAVNRRTGMFADSRWGVGPAFPYRNACQHVLRRTLPTARWTLAWAEAAPRQKRGMCSGRAADPPALFQTDAADLHRGME